MVIGDDHVHALAAGVTGCLVRGDAGVAGEDQPRARRDHLLQVRQVNAVRGGLAHRHVVADMRTQVAQGSDQQRGGGLAVHVEIAPHADRLAAADGAPQPVDRPRHARQRLRRGRDVRVRIEESDRRGRGQHPAAREGLRHERVPADRGGQRGGDGDVRGREPGTRHSIARIPSPERQTVILSSSKGDCQPRPIAQHRHLASPRCSWIAQPTHRSRPVSAPLSWHATSP